MHHNHGLGRVHTNDFGGATFSSKHGQDAGATANIQHASAFHQGWVLLKSISVGLSSHLQHDQPPSVSPAECVLHLAVDLFCFLR